MAEIDFAPWRARVDAALAVALPDPDPEPRRLHQAMRHAVLLGGNESACRPSDTFRITQEVRR